MGTFVVTGGNGFLGRSLVARLHRAGHRVIVASRATSQHNNADDWVEFDLQDGVTANNIANARPDGVFHLAWSTTPAIAEQAPASDISTNLAGTVNLLDRLAEVDGLPVVLLSSGGTVYGNAGTEPISEHQPLHPISIYGTTKLAMEHYATHCRLFADLDVRIARVSNPFGLGQPLAKMQGAATVFARKIIRGEPIEIWGDGHIVRDYIDVEDVASGLIALMDMETPRFRDSPAFNIGSGHGLSLLDLIRELEWSAGRRADVRFRAPRGFDVPVNILNVSKLESQSHWVAGDVGERLHSLVLALRRTLDY